MDSYKAISCTFVDIIEHFATKGEIVLIKFRDGNGVKELSDVITTWYNESSGEYMKLENYELDIRLDQLISINEHILDNYC